MARKLLPLSFRRRAERLAASERTMLRLADIDRLDPRRLAEQHNVRVVKLSELAGVSELQRDQLMTGDSKELSALLVGDDGDAVLVVNDSHTPQRQANSMCHELAHVLLGHRAGAQIDAAGNRIYPQRQEDEANWLAGALLVPIQGLRKLYPQMERPAIEQRYGVSPELLRWRCNLHGMAERS